IQRRVTRSAPAVRVADVDVHNRRACAGRVDRRVGDLLGGHGDVLAGSSRVTGAGDCAGDEDLSEHGSSGGAYRDGPGAGGAAPRCNAASIVGVLASNFPVYSAWGEVNTSSVAPDSTIRPSVITTTRSAIVRISARLWVMNSMLRP